MSEGPLFTHTPAQEDAVPRSGASRKGKREEALDEIARAEIDEPVEASTMSSEEVSEDPDESIITTYTTPNFGGTSLRDVMPILSEQADDTEANETGTDEIKGEDVEEITEEELEQEIAQRMQEQTPHVPASSPRAPGAEILRQEKEPVPDYEQMTFDELKDDKLAGPILERECWRVLQHNDHSWNRNDYGEQLTHDGYLKRKDGTKTELKPSMVVTPTPQGTPRGGNLVKLAVYRTKDKLGRRMQAIGQVPTTQATSLEMTRSVTENSAETTREHIDTVAEELEAPKPTQEPEVLESEEFIRETPEEVQPTQEPEENAEESEQDTAPVEPDVTESGEESLNPEESTEHVDADEDSPTSEEEPKQIHHTLEPEHADSPNSAEESEVEKRVVPDSAEKREGSPEEKSATETESASVWRETREKYRALRGEMMQAKSDWEDAEEQYQGVRSGGILARMFDSAELKKQRDEKQERYLALLEQLRAERENRMNAFMKERVKQEEYEEPAHMKEGEKPQFVGQEKASRYAAFHEALLDRRIDQDIILIERMNAGVKQPESLARAWGGVRQFGRWYGSLSKTQKVAIGAGIGFGVGALGAVASGSALAILGAGAVTAGRRAGGVLFTGTVGGAVAGFVKGNVDALASKYVDRKQQETKETFSQKKLGETLENRLKIRKTGGRIRTAGTVGAGAAVVTASVIAGKSMAEGLHDALPESVQQAMDTASTADVVETGSVATQEATPITEPQEVVPQPETIPDVDDVGTDLAPEQEAPIIQPQEEVSVVEESTQENAPSVEEKSPDDFTDEYVPPTEDTQAPETAEDTPSTPDVDTGLVAETQSDEVFPRNQLPETSEQEWDTQAYLREVYQNMQVDDIGTIENSPVPDEVLARAENFNAASQELPSVYTVEKGDSIWKILEKNLEARGSFEGLNEAQRIHLIDDLKDEITKLSSDELKEIGIESGKADAIQIGEQIDLSSVLDEESVDTAVAKAVGLSDSQATSILEQQKGTHTAGHTGAHENISKTELSGIQPEATDPAPFTSISSLGEVTEQVPVGSSIRSGDFPHAQAEFENATKLEAVHNIDTDTSRSVVENLFHNQNIFSRTIEGHEKMFHANWNAISQLTMKDVFNGDGKLVLGGGRMSPTLLGADAERLVRTMIDQVADGMADRGVPNAQSLLTQAQQEDWSVGTFFNKLGTELEVQAATNDTTPIATLASLDASEAVAEGGSVPGSDVETAEQSTIDTVELSVVEKERAMHALEKIVKAHAPDDRPLSPAQERLLTKRAVQVFVHQYAMEEKIDTTTALERLNQMSGDYADKYLGDADGVVEADEGNALRTFSEENPGFKALRQLMEENDSAGVYPEPVATLASLDASNVVQETPANTEQVAEIQYTGTPESTVGMELTPTEQEHAMDTLEKLSQARAGEHITNPVQQRLLAERAAKVLIQQYAAEENIDVDTAVERLYYMTGEYAAKYAGDADGVIEEGEPSTLSGLAKHNTGFGTLLQMVEEREENLFPKDIKPGDSYRGQGGVYREDGINKPTINHWEKVPDAEPSIAAEEVPEAQVREPAPKEIYRPRRTPHIINEEIGGRVQSPKGAVEVGGRVGVRFGGDKPYQYVGVRVNDPISPKASGLIEGEYLRTNPEWRDVTARELIERDPAFEKVWRQYVGSEDGDPKTVDNRWGRISQEGKSRSTPLYRAPVDPRDIEKLKDMKGGDALKQLEDQLEEYKDRYKRPIRIQGNRVRIYPFKD